MDRLQVFDSRGAGWFFSDLHLRRSQAADNEIYRFLRERIQTRTLPEWIIWGGDVFDFLVGDNRYALASVGGFVELMHQVSESGVRQYLIEGNHDFHLDWLGQEVNGLTVASDGFRDDQARRSFVHGDGHAPGPIYLPLRRLFRRPETRRFLELLPDRFVDAAATRWSRGSYELRGAGQVDEEYLSRVVNSFSNTMSKYPGYTWISGHIHLPLHLLTDSGEWWINGSWQLHRSLVIIPENLEGKPIITRVDRDCTLHTVAEYRTVNR